MNGGEKALKRCSDDTDKTLQTSAKLIDLIKGMSDEARSEPSFTPALSFALQGLSCRNIDVGPRLLCECLWPIINLVLLLNLPDSVLVRVQTRQ